MKNEKISTKTFRQKVYEKLREKIINAEILPGETITMRELASIFGVSLMPVREALWQLESEKVIVIESNRSIHVSSLNLQDISDIFNIRIALEVMAAKRACQLRPESILGKAEHYLNGMRKNLDNPKQYLFNNSQFHFTIYSCSNSPILIQQINSLWARIGPYLSIQYAKGGNIGAAMNCHEGMYEALCKRDKTKMVKFLRKDLEDAAKFIIPLVEASGEKKGGKKNE